MAADVVARRSVDDPHLVYLDGLELFGQREWDAMPMPDLLHPDAAGQRHIGERFAELLPTLVRGVVRAAPREQASVREAVRTALPGGDAAADGAAVVGASAH